MAYVVHRPAGNWEIRASERTDRGPRSRTLATFRVLDTETVEQAVSRAGGKTSADEIYGAARRAGAPIARSRPNAAAADLLRELSRGRRPAAGVTRLLGAALGDGAEPPTDSERAMADWIGATDRERGDALRELLLLGDALPKRRRPAQLSFPPLRSSEE